LVRHDQYPEIYENLKLKPIPKPKSQTSSSYDFAKRKVFEELTDEIIYQK
jgi:hypothetical protein